ncbi:MAG: YchJ family protein [Gammaproteobacteria bacterium]
MNDKISCPCSSGLSYAACCEPLITGEAMASGPEALMRSRYTAYALEIIPYLARTLHPSQRNDYDEAGAAKWAREADWERLEVVDVSPDPANADRGTVEFKAHYKRAGTRLVHHERAEFRKSDGNWYFYDGKMVSAGQVRRETPKVGRNEPCPCGSGKKYKKCCGQGN